TLNGGLGPSTGAFGFGGTVTVNGTTQSTISATTGNANFIRLGRQLVFESTNFNVSDAAGRLLVDVELANNFGASTAGLIKSGLGTLVLSGSNSYTGSTAVNAGQLTVNGVLGSGALSVAAGSILAGSGTIGGVATVDGTLSPGNSPGMLTLASLVLSSSATTLMEINDLTRGAQYDGINLTTAGGLTYGGLLSLSFGLASAVADQTTFDLFNFSGTPTGDFSGVASTGFYAGTWSQVASGTWSLQSGAQTLTFSTATGDVVIVPEPGALALAAAGIGLAAAAWARRRT
ncbi:MAG: PEP-CTERM sorting domain-containing protein, partial [Planctomycetia bacterium]|nr:PEP-CTERM sorting domain-containing protein [Planctomycetia bacterium]